MASVYVNVFVSELRGLKRIDLTSLQTSSSKPWFNAPFWNKSAQQRQEPVVSTWNTTCHKSSHHYWLASDLWILGLLQSYLPVQESPYLRSLNRTSRLYEFHDHLVSNPPGKCHLNFARRNGSQQLTSPSNETSVMRIRFPTDRIAIYP